MIKDAQDRKLRQLLGEGHPLYRAALKAGMDAKSARKYRHADRLPSESLTPRTWRTREDPFQDVWPQLRDLLELNPGLQAKTLFEDLQRRFPGRFPDIQLRTLQRKIKAWRATELVFCPFCTHSHQPIRLPRWYNGGGFEVPSRPGEEAIMFALPKAALPLFRSVAGACVLPTAKRLLTLMLGAILATGRRTITNLLRAVGGLAPGHPSSYHRVFSRRRWSLWPLAHGLADLILRHWGIIGVRGDYWAGSPRVMAHPGLPQIQTCRLPASGSSSHDFAAQLKGLWTTRALGRPYRSSSRSKSDHERGLPRRRRDSHRFQICRAPRRKFWRLAMLPMIP